MVHPQVWISLSLTHMVASFELCGSVIEGKSIGG